MHICDFCELLRFGRPNATRFPGFLVCAKCCAEDDRFIAAEYVRAAMPSLIDPLVPRPMNAGGGPQ